MESAASGALRAACLACAPLFLLAPAVAPAQAPLQSSLSAEVTRPQDAAQAALKAGNAQRALDVADTALGTFPHDATLRFVRGVALTSLQRLPEAEQAFEALTREYPELPEPYNNLAVVRAAQGRLDLAREALEGAIRAVPDYAIAHENLGDIYARLAARSYRTAQQLDPANKTVAPKLKLVSAVPVQPSPRQPAGPAGGNPP